jgi:hypothetical protein
MWDRSCIQIFCFYIVSIVLFWFLFNTVGTLQWIYLSNNSFCAGSNPVLGLIRVEFFSVLTFCLNSRGWFVLCVVCIPYLVLVQVFGDRDWLYRLGPIEYVLSKAGDWIQSPKRCVFNKNMAMDNIQKHNICINVPASQIFRSYLQTVCLKIFSALISRFANPVELSTLTQRESAFIILWVPPTHWLSFCQNLIDTYVVFAFIRCGLPPALRNLLGGCLFMWEEEHKQYIQLAILKTKQIRNKTITK